MTTTSVLIENIHPDAEELTVSTFSVQTREVLSVAHLSAGDSEVFHLYRGQGIEVIGSEEAAATEEE